MNKFLAVLALTTALTGAANATQFDTSKVSIEEKSFLVVMISEHTANCPGEPWSLVKDFTPAAYVGDRHHHHHHG